MISFWEELFFYKILIYSISNKTDKSLRNKDMFDIKFLCSFIIITHINYRPLQQSLVPLLCGTVLILSIYYVHMFDVRYNRTKFSLYSRELYSSSKIIVLK